MFTLEELQLQVEAYKSGRVSRAEFRDWFEARSFDAYEDEALRQICVAIDTAFSEYYFDGIDEDALKRDLGNAIAPEAWRSAAMPVVEGIRWNGPAAPEQLQVESVGSNNNDNVYVPPQSAGSNSTFQVLTSTG